MSDTNARGDESDQGDDQAQEREVGDNANDNGPPTWQEHLHEQSYGTPEPPPVEPEPEPEPPADPEGQRTERETSPE